MNTIPRSYTAHQPLLFPAIYMWNRMHNVNRWVEMTTAQFTRNSGQANFKLLDPDGNPQPFTIATKRPEGRETPVSWTLIDNPLVEVERLSKTLRHLYAKAEFYPRLSVSLNATMALYARSGVTLPIFSFAVLQWVAFTLGAKHITDNHVLDTDIGERPPGTSASSWLASMSEGMVRKFHQPVGSFGNYLCGHSSLHGGYLDPKAFARWHVKPVAQDFRMPTYYRYAGTKRQQAIQDATVSILDPLFHIGPDATKALISEPSL